ncbi:MAG TPA: efflux RND transporter periplasmic adaptor subunit [Casimicrobiaceae bacterium]|nr:efflux RND transporter periplasmic adaptor subunit [Casimicrobiaceae bacterium]
MSRRSVVAGLVVLVAVGAVGGAVALQAARKAEAERSRPKGPVTLEFAPGDLVRVEARPLARWLPVSGTVQAVRQATVKAKVPGEVRQMSVREGEAVRAGQPVARIETSDLEARLAERQGALESARAQLALAEKTRSMNNRLLAEKFISQNAYDGSQSSHDVAVGNVKSAEAQVRLAQNALKDATVTAPIAGVVAKRHVQAGDKVAVESPLLTVVDLAELELAALVPASDVPELATGMPVELAVDGFGERRFRGIIGRINPSAEPGTRAFHVYVSLPNPDAALRSGMFATGRIALASSAPTPALPLAAVRTEAGQSFVWTIDEGKLVRRVVSVGRRDDEAGLVEVRTALPPGIAVLAARFDNLKEGAAAIVRAPASSTNAASTARTPG